MTCSESIWEKTSWADTVTDIKMDLVTHRRLFSSCDSVTAKFELLYVLITLSGKFYSEKQFVSELILQVLIF